MKKLLCLLTVFMILLIPITVGAAESIVETDQKIMYEGKIVNIKDPIINIDGSLYVPIRTFCENIGLTVKWTPENITISDSITSFVLTNSDYRNIKGTGYIGLRLLGTSLKREVGYNNDTRTASIGIAPNDNKSNVVGTVMIDAGHGGHDPGAVGNGVNEEDVNLYISKKVKDLLINDGITVLMTREDDTYVSLSDRYNLANEKNVDLFVSIHNNSAENSSARGTEVLCNFGTDSEVLAKNILDEVVGRINTTNRGLKDGKRMAVIRGTDMPAVIVEGLFISNSSDAKMLKDTTILDAIAEGIYKGIKKTLK